MTRTNAERQDAITKLREWIKPGDTVYTILDSVSRSGMSRHIRVVLPQKDARGVYTGDFLHPNYSVAKALGYRQAKRGDGLVVGDAAWIWGSISSMNSRACCGQKATAARARTATATTTAMGIGIGNRTLRWRRTGTTTGDTRSSISGCRCLALADVTGRPRGRHHA